MIPFRRVGISGLGLMGGSLARALAGRGVEVWGEDRAPEVLHAARDDGVLAGPLEEALEEIELLVLALPVTAAPERLAGLASRLPAGCLVTDLGSTKRSIAAAAERLGLAERFVGSHPLAGSHRSGWESADPDLYRGARVFVCPAADTTPATLRRVGELWSSLGARPEVLDAAEHDLQLAWTSHLPQVASTALALALADHGHPLERMGPGGRDATRLAASSPEIWSAISLDNAEPLAAALNALVEQLSEARASLLARDEAALRAFFARGQAWRG